MSEPAEANGERGGLAVESEGGAAGRSSRRRWLWIIAGAATTAVVATLAIALVASSGRGRHSRAIAETAAQTTPEVADLILETEAVVDRLLDDYPESADAMEVMVRLQMRFGDADEAAEWCRRCLAIAPAFAEAHHTLGILARRKAEFAEAFEHFSKAVELVPEAQSYRLDLADALLKLNQWEEASKVLATSLEADPSFVPSLFLLGDVCVRQGDYQKAIEILERAVALAPDFAKPYHPLATAYARLGDSAKAAQCVARFRALQSKTDQWYREELKALDDITRVRFQVADIYTAASHVRLLFDDPQAALEYLQRAVELSPDSVESGQTLAWLHERQGRPEEALRTLCDLRDRVPDNLTVHVSLGSLCTRMGRFDEAEQAYRKAIALTPQRAEPYAALIDLCLKSNRKLPEAKLLSLKVVALSPVARHYFLLSTVCGRTGDVTGARSALEHALALDPENDRLKQAWQGLTPRAGK